MRKVFVTGVGFTSSIGNDYATVLDSLLNLKTGIELYPPFQRDDIPVKLAGTIKGFDLQSNDPEDWVYPKDKAPGRALLRSLAPHGLYCYFAIEQAIAQAGLSEEHISNSRTGFHSASAGSPTNLAYYVNRMHQHGVDRLSPKAIVASIPGTINFSFVSHYKIKGSSCGFVSACASSGHALGYALDEIRLGRQDRMIIVGGEDGDLNTILPFAAMRALSPETTPEKGAKPFDVERSGFIGTGGAAAMIIEAEDAIAKRGGTPLVEFKGWGQSSDGFSAVLPEPEGAGLARSMRFSLESAGLNADDVDYINAHATATIPGDIAELKAIKDVFGPDSKVKISSTKALTGHGLSLSSILEAGISVISLVEGICPGTAHLEKLDPEAGNLDVISQTEKSQPRAVLSNSSGFGGANVSLVFEKVGNT